MLGTLTSIHSCSILKSYTIVFSGRIAPLPLSHNSYFLLVVVTETLNNFFFRRYFSHLCGLGLPLRSTSCHSTDPVVLLLHKTGDPRRSLPVYYPTTVSLKTKAASCDTDGRSQQRWPFKTKMAFHNKDGHWLPRWLFVTIFNKCMIFYLLTTNILSFLHSHFNFKKIMCKQSGTADRSPVLIPSVVQSLIGWIQSAYSRYFGLFFEL